MEQHPNGCFFSIEKLKSVIKIICSVTTWLRGFIKKLGFLAITKGVSTVVD